ncbi:conserved hypothetical protein, partial [Ricinus communis]
MAAIEAVVHDRDILGGAIVARLDGDVVVAGADMAVGDGDVARRDGIDAVGIARGGWRVNADAPGGEAIHPVQRHVEVGRIAQRDLVQRDVLRVGDFDQARHVLA